MAIGLVALSWGLWKVGIFWDIFVKFAYLEMVTLTIIWSVEHDMSFISWFHVKGFVRNILTFQNGTRNSCNGRKCFKNPANLEIEWTGSQALKFNSKYVKWKLMDQIIWNFSSYARVKYILHTTDTIVGTYITRHEGKFF